SERPSAWASALAASVLPTPGTPSISSGLLSLRPRNAAVAMPSSAIKSACLSAALKASGLSNTSDEHLLLDKEMVAARAMRRRISTRRLAFGRRHSLSPGFWAVEPHFADRIVW